MAEDEDRRCCSCGQRKPISEFNRNQFNCRSCAKKKYRAWRIANREYHARRNNRWHHAHKKIVSSRQKLYRERNAEAVAERKREYHRANAEVICTKVREWQNANPLKRKAQVHKRRSLKNSLPHDWTDSDARFALEYFKFRCAACRKARKICWDHWIPLAGKGCPGTIPANMIPLCMFCNSTKGERPALKWLNERFPSQAEKIVRCVARYFSAAVNNRRKVDV